MFIVEIDSTLMYRTTHAFSIATHTKSFPEKWMSHILYIDFMAEQKARFAELYSPAT
jgi:hypothetical protein